MMLVRRQFGDIFVFLDSDLGRWVFAGGPAFPDPANMPRPHDGSVFFRTDLNAHYVWDEPTATWTIVGGGGGVTDAEYLTAAAHAGLSAERVTTDTSTITWDHTVGGQAKANVPNNSITFAKMQDVATDRLVGRDTAATGDPEELTVGGGLEFSGAGGIQTAAFTGDVTKAAGGTAQTIANDAVTDAKLRNSAAVSVIGRAANSSGDPADIAAGADGQYLQRQSSALSWAGLKFADLIVSTDEQTVGSSVTVLSSLTDVVSSSSLTLTAGQYLAVWGHIHLTKGGTAGQTTEKVYQSAGTAVLEWLSNAGSVTAFMNTPGNHAANVLWARSFGWEILKVTTGGTATITIQASSAGSNGTVGLGGATIKTIILR